MTRAATKRDRLEAREAVLVAAATEVYLEQGIDGATMAEIARRANVGDGTIYLYFKNKSALLLAVVAAHWARITEAAASSLDGPGDYFTRLEAHARYHVSMLVRDWKLIDLSVALHYADKATAFEATALKRTYTLAFDAQYKRALDAGEINSEIPVSAVRDMFYGGLEYAARTIMLRRKKADIDAAVAAHMQIFHNGLNVSTKSNAQKSSKTPVDEMQRLTTRLERVAKRLEKTAR